MFVSSMTSPGQPERIWPDSSFKIKLVFYEDMVPFLLRWLFLLSHNPLI